MKSTIDPLELQRLLDGRLTRTERAAFLDGLDDDPRHWRTIALAFVEEQVMRSAFRPANDAVAPPPAKLPQRKLRGRSSWLLTSIALMAFSLTVGVLFGKSGFLSAKRNAVPDASGDASLVAEAVRDKKPNDYYVVVTPPAQPAPVKKTTQPEPERDAFDALTTPIFDERAREIARKNGYRVSEEPVVYMISDGKGGQYVIPRRLVSFVPEKK